MINMKESQIKGLAGLVLVLFLSHLAMSCAPKSISSNRPLDGLGGLETGDMVFLDLDCGEICDAIESVTLQQFQVTAPRLSHVGIIEAVHDKTYIWEAWPEKGVQRIPLINFLSRVQGGEGRPNGYFIGRLKSNFRMAARKFVVRLKKYEGRPYDEKFTWGANAFYCSELVSLSFSPSLFPPKPMYFGEAGSPERSAWEKYFLDRKQKVPDGKLGISPLGIYLSGKEKLFLSDEE